MARGWISKLHKGGLHESLGIPQDEPIPKARLRRALRAKGKLGKQARAAKTLAKLRKRR